MMRKKRHDAVEWSCCGFSSKNNLRISAINFYCAIFQDLFSVLPLLMHFFSPSGLTSGRELLKSRISQPQKKERAIVWVKYLALAWNSLLHSCGQSLHTFPLGYVCTWEKWRTDKSAIKFSTERECRWTVDMRMRYFRQVRAYGRRVDSSVLLARALHGIIKHRWMIFITNDLSKWELYAL